jgi:aspartate-semialdehyde dehydrogenase
VSFAVAVGGATGNVGREMIRTLEQRSFPVGRFFPLASAESAAVARTVWFRDEAYPVGDLARFDFRETDILFLSTGAKNAREIAPRAAAAGCVVIDNSSAFRMEPQAPLVVPEVNAKELNDARWKTMGILPVANCSTIQMVVALKPLHDAARIKRIVVATYQAAAGGGRQMLDRLMSPADPVSLDMRGLMRSARQALGQNVEKPIAFNVVPHVDIFLDDGRTKEEWKLEAEARRILDDPSLQVAATCVRVPVFVGHAEAINVEFHNPITATDARDLLAHAPGVCVLDERVLGGYATPLEVEGTDLVYVSRIREDATVENGLSLWVVADNLRKGAALNAVQIAEAVVARKAIIPKPKSLD